VIVIQRSAGLAKLLIEIVKDLVLFLPGLSEGAAVDVRLGVPEGIVEIQSQRAKGKEADGLPRFAGVVG
jgi:hypothetical protein